MSAHLKNSGRTLSYAVVIILIAVITVMVVMKSGGEAAASMDNPKADDLPSDQNNSRRSREPSFASASRQSQRSVSVLPQSLAEASPRLQAEVQIEQVVREARERLKGLQFHFVQIDSEERQALREKLQSVESPEERHQLLSEHREVTLAKREEFENSLTAEQKAARVRYQAISRLTSIQHSLPRLGWAEEFRGEVEVLENDLINFTAVALDSDQETFDQQWSVIQQKHQELMSRSMEMRRALAAREN